MTRRPGARMGRARAGVLSIAVSVAVGGLAAPGAAAAAPSLTAREAILVAPATGQQLFAIAPGAQVPIASTTKLMTALVTLEHVHRLGTVFTQNDFYPAAADSQIGLVPGERMSVHDLLIALLLPSADDAAEDLAFGVGHGSVARFVAMMNARARQLGLTHTHYSTPSGLDTPGNYSSAGDLVSLAAYLLGHERFFARVVALPRAVLRTGRSVRAVVNRNDLVARYPWIDGVKTGHTRGAGYVLVASAHRRHMWLLSAVLGTGSEASRDANTLALLRYGYASFRLAEPVRVGQVLARTTVRYRSGEYAQLVAGRSFQWVLPRGTPIALRVRAPTQLSGPIAAGTVEGSVMVLAGGHLITRIPLVLARALPSVSPLTIATSFLLRPTTLLLALVIAVLAASLATRVRRDRRRQRVTSPA